MSLYKYTSIQTAEIVIKNQSLRWSSPLIFNDLEECQFTPFTKEKYFDAISKYKDILINCANRQLVYDVNRYSDVTNTLIEVIKMALKDGKFSPEHLLDMTSNLFGDPESDYRNYINEALVRCFRVLCVTEDCDNKLMWGYYADQNYGCAIEFEHLYSERPRLLREGYVRYHDNLNPRSNPLDILLYGETEEVRNLMIQDVIFSKRKLWSHENEYRLMFSENFGVITTEINMQTKQKNISVEYQPESLFTDVKFPKEAIKSIIFGARTTKDCIDRVLGLASDYGYKCDFYKMEMENGTLIKRDLLDLSTN
ncbi:DUF2971 domain-containing protein [Aeromonas veronii]